MTMIYRRDHKNQSLDEFEPERDTKRKKKRQDKLPLSQGDDRKT